MATRKDQRPDGLLLEVYTSFVQSPMSWRSTGGPLSHLHPPMFVNMDETAEYFEAKPKSTVHPSGANTIPIRCTGSSNQCLRAYVTVASDGTKLSLFLNFKGKPHGRIEVTLHHILPEGVFACCE